MILTLILREVINMKEHIERGSGNVFKDIGAAHPERVLFRAQIMARITEIIRERGMTQKSAAKLLNLPQSKVSCLMNGKLSMFSLEHLFEILNALDTDVEIIIKPRSAEERFASTHVLVAVMA
jgi:predicted XRE-type DNA-binding protein